MANEIFHYGAVTIRVVGEGNLDMTLKGFDAVLTKTIAALPMSTTNYKESTRKVNFKSQRALLRVETDEIGEYFKINNITIWVKPIATMYPS